MSTEVAARAYPGPSKFENAWCVCQSSIIDSGNRKSRDQGTLKNLDVALYGEQ